MSENTNGVLKTGEDAIPFPKITDDDPAVDREKDARSRKRGESTSHRRSLSGNIFSKLTFLRSNSEQDKNDGVNYKTSPY